MIIEYTGRCCATLCPSLAIKMIILYVYLISTVVCDCDSDNYHFCLSLLGCHIIIISIIIIDNDGDNYQCV
jgi:hypothetical protein